MFSLAFCPPGSLSLPRYAFSQESVLGAAVKVCSLFNHREEAAKKKKKSYPLLEQTLINTWYLVRLRKKGDYSAKRKKKNVSRREVHAQHAPPSLRAHGSSQHHGVLHDTKAAVSGRSSQRLQAIENHLRAGESGGRRESQGGAKEARVPYKHTQSDTNQQTNENTIVYVKQ